MRVTSSGVCLSVIVNEKSINLKKTTSSFLSVFLLIYGLVNQANAEIPRGAVLNQSINPSPRLGTLTPIQLPPMAPQFRPPIGPGLTALRSFFPKVQLKMGSVVAWTKFFFKNKQKFSWTMEWLNFCKNDLYFYRMNDFINWTILLLVRSVPFCSVLSKRTVIPFRSVLGVLSRRTVLFLLFRS